MGNYTDVWRLNDRVLAIVPALTERQDDEPAPLQTEKNPETFSKITSGFFPERIKSINAVVSF